MKFRAVFLLVVSMAAMVFLTVGCSTTVTVSHMVPAEINMSNYRNLAVSSISPYAFGFFNRPASIVPDHSGDQLYRVYSGFGPYGERDTAITGTRNLVSVLDDAAYFKLLVPAQVDTVVGTGGAQSTMLERVRRSGADALLTNRCIEDFIYAQDVNKMVDKDPVTGVVLDKPELRTVKGYFLRQKLGITFSYEIVDVKTGRVLISDTFNRQSDSSKELTGDPEKPITAPSIESTFSSMVADFNRTIRNQIAPRWERTVVSLMDNKPEMTRAKNAWDEAKRGNYAIAKDLFLKEWNRSKHIPSGYNAALLTEALGDLKKALELMTSVYRESGNQTVNNQISRMRRALESQQQAEQQL